MKFTLLALSGAMLSACSMGDAPLPQADQSHPVGKGKSPARRAARSATADAHRRLARIRLGTPEHKVEPPGSSIAGYATVEFPVHVTNTSARPIWLNVAGHIPFHSLLIRRAKEGRWCNETLTMCGLGAGFSELAPDASTTFTVFVSADDIGNQIRVGLSIYRSPDLEAKSIEISSPPARIR